nr:hypothetical protein [uncultured Pedobacter sp.]
MIDTSNIKTKSDFLGSLSRVTPKNKEHVYKRVFDRYAMSNKEDYLKDCIGYFLLNVFALRKKDILTGFEEARQIVKTQNGFGKVDDIRFTGKTIDGITRTFRIRIIGIDRPSLSQSENHEILLWKSNYVIVSTIDEFYKWYVKNFGEVEI